MATYHTAMVTAYASNSDTTLAILPSDAQSDLEAAKARLLAEGLTTTPELEAIKGMGDLKTYALAHGCRIDAYEVEQVEI